MNISGAQKYERDILDSRVIEKRLLTKFHIINLLFQLKYTFTLSLIRLVFGSILSVYKFTLQFSSIDLEQTNPWKVRANPKSATDLGFYEELVNFTPHLPHTSIFLGKILLRNHSNTVHEPQTFYFIITSKGRLICLPHKLIKRACSSI